MFNILGVFLAVVSMQAAGYFWYSPYLFVNLWFEEVKKPFSDKHLKGKTPLCISTLINIILVFFLNYVIRYILKIQDLESTLLLVLCLYMPAACLSATHYAYAGQSLTLYLINMGYMAISLLVPSIVLFYSMGM